jgi:hypothetical protein
VNLNPGIFGRNQNRNPSLKTFLGQPTFHSFIKQIGFGD